MSITEHLFHPLINALSWTILHSIWQFALIALFWHLAIKLAAKSGASLRYNLSLISLLVMPLSFAITFLRQYAVYGSASQIVSMEFENATMMAIQGGTDFFMIAKSHPALLARFEAFTPYVFTIYIAGLVFFSVISLLTYSKWFALKRSQTRTLPNEWSQRIVQLRRLAGIGRHISVYLSTKVDIPMVVGFIKPVILLPVAMLSSLTADQVEVIILHELYHIRRKDHFINALQCLLEILFFYHPASWLISRQLRQEREKRVDEWVVQQTNKPLMYAEALIHLEEKRSKPALQPAVAATQSKSLLFTRIKNFMTMKTRNFNAGQKLAAVLAVVAAFVSMAWINPATTINLFDNPSAGEYQSAALDHYDVTALSYDEIAPDEAPAYNAEKSNEKSEPRTIILHDGSKIQWEGLSERDQKQIARAMEEMSLAMQKINTEVFNHLSSEEFRLEMQEAIQEASKASEEAAKAGEEIRKAMEELREYMDREEFREKTRKAGEEVQNAMKELRIQLESEEFKAEMQKAQEDIKNAMKELEEVDWDAIRKDVREAMLELNKGLQEMEVELQEISPLIREMMQEFGQGMQEFGPVLQEILKGVERGMQELGPVLHDLFKEIPVEKEDN